MRHKRGKIALLTLWPVAGLVLLLSRCSDRFAEFVFARGIYRVYHTVLAFLTGWIPVSVGEWILYALIPAGIAMLTVWMVHIVKGGRGALLCGAVNALCLLGIVFFMFVFGCGANYYRYTYARCAGMTVATGTDEELHTLCTSLAQRANELRVQLVNCEDARGVFALPYAKGELAEHARQAMTELGKDVDVFSGYYARPKQVFWSEGLSRLGITGVYFPFTAEANVNVDAADYTLGAAMCHELSHMAGFMREDEANYLSYVVCRRSGDPVLDYSGTMLALTYASNALYKSAPALYRQVHSLYGEGLRRDLAANAAYWQAYEGKPASEFGEKMNDAYLKANNQTAGTKSYGEMVDLLLAEFRETAHSEGDFYQN